MDDVESVVVNGFSASKARASIRVLTFGGVPIVASTVLFPSRKDRMRVRVR